MCYLMEVKYCSNLASSFQRLSKKEYYISVPPLSSSQTLCLSFILQLWWKALHRNLMRKHVLVSLLCSFGMSHVFFTDGSSWVTTLLFTQIRNNCCLFSEAVARYVFVCVCSLLSLVAAEHTSSLYSIWTHLTWWHVQLLMKWAPPPAPLKPEPGLFWLVIMYNVLER